MYCNSDDEIHPNLDILHIGKHRGKKEGSVTTTRYYAGLDAFKYVHFIDMYRCTFSPIFYSLSRFKCNM